MFCAPHPADEGPQTEASCIVFANFYAMSS